MTKRTAILKYRFYSKAEGYIIGFIYNHTLYWIQIEEIPPRFMNVERESKKKGGKEKLQLRLHKKDKEHLIRKGAQAIGSEKLLEGKYNRGVEFERIIYKLNNQTFRGKESTGFWIMGDIAINNKQIQIKLEGAQIVVYSTLKNLDKKRKRG